MTEEEYHHNYHVGFIHGIVTGAAAVIVTAAAYGAYYIIKLNVGWTKTELKKRKELRELKENQ